MVIQNVMIPFFLNLQVAADVLLFLSDCDKFFSLTEYKTEKFR